MTPRGSRLGALSIAAWLALTIACSGGPQPPAANQPVPAASAAPAVPAASTVPAAPVAAAGLLPARPLPDGWVAFDVPELGMQVELPRAPEGSTGKMVTSRGPIEFRRFSARQGARTYELALTDIPGGAMKDLGFFEVFAELRAATVGSIGGEVVSEEMRTHEGFPVRHMRLTGTHEGRPISAEVRTMIAGDRSYQMSVFSPPADESEADTERFMASLHVAGGACAHVGAGDNAPIQVQREPKVGAVYRVRAEFDGQANMRLDATVSVVVVVPERFELDVEFHAFPEPGIPLAELEHPRPRRVVISRKQDLLDYEFHGEDADSGGFMKAMLSGYHFEQCTLPEAPHRAGDTWQDERVARTLLGVEATADGKWASFGARLLVDPGPLPPGAMLLPVVTQRVKVDDGFVGRCAVEILFGNDDIKDQRGVRLIEVTRVR